MPSLAMSVAMSKFLIAAELLDCILERLVAALLAVLAARRRNLACRRSGEESCDGKTYSIEEKRGA
jgi:hypothetical protein